MIFILLSSQFLNCFLVSLLLDRFLNSQIVRILVKGALIIALFGIKSVNRGSICLAVIGFLLRCDRGGDAVSSLVFNPYPCCFSSVR